METPLGKVAVNKSLCSELMTKSGVFDADIRAHAREHSLEVQLPFIQMKSDNFTIIPICLEIPVIARVQGNRGGHCFTCESAWKWIAHCGKLWYVSLPDTSRRRETWQTSPRQLPWNESREFYQTIQQHQISMCGFIPATCLLYAANELGATKAELIKYMTSGDVSGDYSHVVGYAGVIVK